MGCPASTGISRAPAYSGERQGRGFHFAYGTFTLYGVLSQHTSATKTLCNSPAALRNHQDASHNPPSATPAGLALIRFGLFPFRSPLLRESRRFLFLRVLRCFTSPGNPRLRGDWTAPAGLPHSGIHGSRAACASPWLFAACYALLRSLVPRHPPYALCTFSSFSFSSYAVVNVQNAHQSA